jgi:Tannase and feruloyl esterase
LKFDGSTIEMLKIRHALLDATNPDLTAFASAGGKLILWHGWADQHISPITTIAYYEAMQAAMGKDKVEAMSRLYLLPGVQHCGRGDGPSSIDLLSAMMNWIETGKAPDAIASSNDQAASNNFGQPQGMGAPKGAPPPEPAPTVRMTRPVFPYPAVAAYKGSGDVNEAANYEKGKPFYTKPVSDWIGADFFKPYKPSMN